MATEPSRQFSLLGEPAPKVRMRSTWIDPGRRHHGTILSENPDMPFIGGKIDVTRAILRSALNEPAEPGTEYGVEGAPLRDVSTKEGRRDFAGDMGLPNTKKKKKRS
jgi:hypothetical protein